MNHFAKVCLAGPSASVSGSSRASDKEDFQCEICKKFFKEKKNMNKHKRLVHSQCANESFMCDNCLKSFVSQIGLDEHRNRKRAGDRMGCLIPKSVKASTRSRSNRSSRSESLPEDVGGVDEDLARTAASQARGFHKFRFLPESKAFGEFSTELLVAGDSCLKEQQLEFQMGLVEAIVKAVVSHPDFNVKSEKPNLTSRYFLQIK